MNEQWLMRRIPISSDDISRYKKLNISPALARIVANRDVTGDDIDLYFSKDLTKLSSPWLLKDMEKAVDFIKIKIAQRDKIRIVGDYDVDGICSTYILYMALKNLGADVDYAIPHRVEDGYGISDKIIDDAKSQHVDTIITCDNGISAHTQIEYAKSLGMSVVVTDHHEVMRDDIDPTKYIVPKADAVIDPKQDDCSYPFKEICGAVVALWFVKALYESLEKDDKIIKKFLMYAGIATVCDVMDLVSENRIIVKNALEMLKTTNDIGILALMDAQGVEQKNISSYHLGFVIGPCLNATGRLDSAKKSVELLLETDSNKAKKMANELVEMNRKRQELTDEFVNKAYEIAEKDDNKVLVIFLPDCHESIAGIVAGRVREKFNKPVIVLTKSVDGAKGSGRSIETYNMFKELSTVKELFTKFGGHPMAAGLSLKEELIDEFRTRINANCPLSENDLVYRVHIDDELNFSNITESFIKSLDLLEPFGKGNSKPSFGNKNLEVKSVKIIGKNQNSARIVLKAPGSSVSMTALLFSRAGELLQTIREVYGNEELTKVLEGRLNSVKMDIVFYPSINEYNGNKSLQIIIDRFRVGGHYASS